MAWGLAIVLLVAACLQFTMGTETPVTMEIEWHTLSWNGLERVFGVYVPSDVNDPAPLVFLLHGGGGSAASTWSQEHGRSWRMLADTYGFVLVLPEGTTDANDESGHHWNDCRIGLDGSAIETGADDVGFVVGLIDTVSAALTMDLSRVYVTGASNGGMMTFRLAIEAGEHFAAAAAVIANLPEPSECTAVPSPIPMLVMNGTEDPVIPYDGGCILNALCLRGRVMSTADTVAYWVNANGAVTEPSSERLRNRAWFDGSRVTVYHYDGGVTGTEVVYYEVEGGGHSVPGFETVSKLAQSIAGFKNRDINGPAEIWAFFQRH